MAEAARPYYFEGRDPLDDRWAAAHFAAHGRPPSDADRQDRLFSLLFLANGQDAAWTDGEWTAYRSNRAALWAGQMAWQAGDVDLGYDRFELHLRRLAGHYSGDRHAAGKFVRAAGLIWGGIAYEGPAFIALFRAGVGDHLQQLAEGPAGWRPEYVDDDNPAHHWVAAFVAGFAYGALIGAVTNSVRDLAQYVTGQGGTLADIRLGNEAARHGALLQRASRKGSAGPGSPVFELLLAQVRQDLKGSG